MRYLLCIGFSFLLLIAVCSGQSGLSAQKNYLEYHERIIDAEKLFLNDDTYRSLRAYKAIFEDYTPFAKDAFIALQLSCMIKDTANAFYFFKRSFETGINLNTALTVRHVSALLERDLAFKARVQSLYKVSRDKYLGSINLPLRKLFTDISKIDDEAKATLSKAKIEYLSSKAIERDSIAMRYIRNKVSDFKKRHPSISADAYERTMRTNYAPKMKADTQYVALLERIVLTIDSIAKKLGYVPGEKTLGLCDDELDGRKYESSTRKLVPIVLQQFYHHGCAFRLMEKELLESVKRGEIHPRIYAIMYEWSYDDLRDQSNNPLSTNLFPLYKINCPPPERNKFYNILPLLDAPRHSDTELVNFTRNAFSICKTEHDLVKREFAKRNHLVLYFGLVGAEQ